MALRCEADREPGTEDRVTADISFSKWWTEVAKVPGTDSSITQGPEGDAQAEALLLRQPLTVSPNPFNPRARVSLFLSERGLIRVEVFDVRGRRVKTLQEGVLPAGNHELIWQGDDDTASPVASGVYWIQLHSAQGTHRERVALVR